MEVVYTGVVRATWLDGLAPVKRNGLMRYTTRLSLLFGSILALAIAGLFLALWVAEQARYNQLRSDLANRSYQSHLSLSSHTYQLFRQFGDAMVIGQRDGGQRAQELLSAVRQDIGDIRDVIAREVQLYGNEEIERLENLARIESLMEDLLDEYQLVLNADYGVAFADEWGRLSRILNKRVDEDFDVLIQRALERELYDLTEVRETAAAQLQMNRRLAWSLMFVGAMAAVLSLWWLVRDLRGPIQRLIVGAEAMARGELQTRIAMSGNSELSRVSHALDRLAGEVANREQALAMSNQRLERAVADRTLELEQLLETLKRAEADRRRLLADVSHELRTPLTIIRGEADIALRGADKSIGEYRDALERTRDAADHTSQLVNDLLFIARREAGEVRLSLGELDLARLLPAIVADSRSLGEENGPVIRLDSRIEQACLRGDEKRIRQVLIIVLENALRYGSRVVDVQLVEQENAYCIRVHNDGAVISEAEQQRVFERFYRGSNAAQRYSQGSGLGLPVARAIIEAHGGSIDLRAEPAQGTTVTIVLPARPGLKAAS